MSSLPEIHSMHNMLCEEDHTKAKPQMEAKEEEEEV